MPKTIDNSVLSEKEWEVLEFIVSFTKERGFPPSCTFVSEHLGMSDRRGAHHILRSLRRKGWVRGTTRTMSVLKGSFRFRNRRLIYFKGTYGKEVE